MRRLPLLILASGCGRFGFDVRELGSGDATTGDVLVLGDGLPLLPDGDLDDDALTAPKYPTFGAETGPLSYGSGCTGGGGVRRVMYGDLPNNGAQDQTITFDYQPSSLMVTGAYTGSGQSPLVSISVRDPGNGIYLLTADGTNTYGSWCIPGVALGTYTVTIVNDETSQVARNLAITIMVGLDGLANCPYSGC